jgi:hypothetical protein
MAQLTDAANDEPGSANNRHVAFVPVSWDDALALRAGADLGPRRACAVTPRLLAELGGQTSVEEAEFAALSNAGVLALLLSSAVRRLVLAAELQSGQVADHDGAHGEVVVSGISWVQVRALFVDEPEASVAVAAARHAIVDGHSEPTLAAALESPEVGGLLNVSDLLWFAPEELDQLNENDDLTEIGRNRAN